MSVPLLKLALERLSSAGRRARELVNRIQSGKVSARETWDELRKLDGILEDAYFAIRNIASDMKYLDVDLDVIGNLWTAEDAIDKMLEIVRILRPLVSGEEVDVKVPERRVGKELAELDEQVYKLTGKHCVGKGSNKLSSILKDLASCIHAVAEHLAKIKTREKCAIVRDGKGKAFCLTWSKAAKENYDAGLYDTQDYEDLVGWVVGDKVYLKLGLGIGEKAFVDLYSGILHYAYWDPLTGKVMKNLLEEFAGLQCKLHDGVVSCTGVSDENMGKVALAISMATSIKPRMENPAEYWGTDVVLESEETMALKWLRELEKEVKG